MLAPTPRHTVSTLGSFFLIAVDAALSSSIEEGNSGRGGYAPEDARGGARGSKPHLVFLFCDNVGWASVGYHRSVPTPEVVTPNIDELVR